MIEFFFPLALAVIMFGLGLSLTPGDFARVLRFPKAVIVGLACQVLFLPLVCFALVKSFNVQPEIAVGFMLLAASPGGVTANLFSHLFEGDVALNITLTAINSVLSAFTLPIILNLSLTHLMGAGRFVPLDFAKVAQIFAIVLIPVAVGMSVHRFFPNFSKLATGAVKGISILFLLILVAIAIYKEFPTLAKYFHQIWAIALSFNIISLLSGYWLGLVCRLKRDQSVAIAMEVGVHNTGLAATIAASPLLLGNMTMAIPSAAYTVSMYFTAAAFGFFLTKGYAKAGSKTVETV